MHVPMSLLAQNAPSYLHLHGYLSFLDNVQLTSNKNKTRRFTCPGDQVVFTCEVFRSSSLEWRNPRIHPPFSYSSNPNTHVVMSQGSFTANLTNFSAEPDTTLLTNFTSTLQVTVSKAMSRNETTVMCLRGNTGENKTDNFTYAGE